MSIVPCFRLHLDPSAVALVTALSHTKPQHDEPLLNLYPRPQLALPMPLRASLRITHSIHRPARAHHLLKAIVSVVHYPAALLPSPTVFIIKGGQARRFAGCDPAAIQTNQTQVKMLSPEVCRELWTQLCLSLHHRHHCTRRTRLLLHSLAHVAPTSRTMKSMRLLLVSQAPQRRSKALKALVRKDRPRTAWQSRSLQDSSHLKVQQPQPFRLPSRSTPPSNQRTIFSYLRVSRCSRSLTRKSSRAHSSSIRIADRSSGSPRRTIASISSLFARSVLALGCILPHLTQHLLRT